MYKKYIVRITFEVEAEDFQSAVDFADNLCYYSRYWIWEAAGKIQGIGPVNEQGVEVVKVVKENKER